MKPARRPKLLLVDDSPPNLDILVGFLATDYDLIVALDGPKAVSLARTLPPPDLILLDVVLPGMDGYEVCRILKSMDNTRDIPILFLTALTDDTDESQGLALGAVDYIRKPFALPVVRNRIANVLRLKFQQGDLEAEVARRTQSLQITQDLAIYGLGILAEFRDPETGEHIQRTATYVQILASALRNTPRFRGYFDPTVIDLLYKSAPLHDIGKVAIHDDILLKPGPLTPAEWEIMKTHTIAGRDIIRRMRQRSQNEEAASFLSLAEEITFHHHERWDGTGYHGVKGDAIPIPGRLMAVADVYDALTSSRVYKDAIPHDEVIRILTEGDGRTRPEHFDPDVLQAFLDFKETFASFAPGPKASDDS